MHSQIKTRPESLGRTIASKFLAAVVIAASFSGLDLLLLTQPAQAERRTDHVFIVSFDGGKPSVMKQSKMPTVFKLSDDGATSWTAQTIFPSITLTSHTSMLTGVSPEKHNTLWNDWEPDQGMVKVPTIFALATKQNLTTAMFVGKPKFIHLYQAHTVNRFSLPSYESKAVAACAAQYIEQRKPNLCFIHFADPDGAGHQYGWGSKEQLQALADSDAALDVVIKSIEKAGIQKNSVVILTADHGGHDKTHGSRSPEDMTIPWIVWGDGVKQGFKIAEPVTTYDTSATALWLLDVPIPKEFDGKPIKSAFNALPEASANKATGSTAAASVVPAAR